MPRVKTGSIRKTAHKKVLAANKGYRMTKSRLYKVAKEAFLHAGKYAYIGRRLKKRDFRTLWITRINAALKTIDLSSSYSKFVGSLKTNKININRKVLAELAIKLPKAFTNIFQFTSR